ncbi:MAG: TetR/AcrR family transcriptional regulator, partial [Rhodomicrobium sp.]
IVAAAERRMREGGFHGFSFREIAADVGIKSASVHHHFPTKEHLGAAVIKAYTKRFLEALGDPNDARRTPRALLRYYVDCYRRALGKDWQMCLCGVITCERMSLPADVAQAAAEYFERNVAWLEPVLRRKSPLAKIEAIRAEALRIITLLEGAMLVTKALNDNRAFELAAKSILQ